MRILHIDTSPASNAATRALGAHFLRALRNQGVDFEVDYMDLYLSPLPPLDANWLLADETPESDRDEAMRERLEESEALIAQLRESDSYLFGLPMHNFTVPASFKLWIDHVVRLGETFGYGPEGAFGMLENKRALVITARGGFYAKANPAADFQEPYVRKVLAYMGVSQVDMVHAEGLLLQADQREKTIAEARAELDDVAARWAAS